jgi:hypothetical protein
MQIHTSSNNIWTHELDLIRARRRLSGNCICSSTLGESIPSEQTCAYHQGAGSISTRVKNGVIFCQHTEVDIRVGMKLA